MEKSGWADEFSRLPEQRRSARANHRRVLGRRITFPGGADALIDTVALRTRPWLSPAIVAGVLMVVYLASLAPGVTYWDAGEFTAAAHTLGIPHPPGTPLYILIGKTWTLVLSFLGVSLALNLFSAICTAGAAAITARLVYRSMGSQWAALAAGIVAGSMSTAWLNATESEVYAVALLLSLLMLECADRAGAQHSWRWLVLTVYLIALAVPLHLSALIAAPAAIVLASEHVRTGDEQAVNAALSRGARWLRSRFPEWRWSWTLTLAGVVVLSIAASGVSWKLASIGLATLGVALGLERTSIPWKSMSVLVAVGIALSALTFMIIRAQHDPGINQGDPSTVARWIAVMTRDQYAVPPMWQRQAPMWLQSANMVQYFDWQLALSLAPEPPVSMGRGLVTLAGLVLGIVGSREHLARDPRRWRAVLALLLSGSLGVMLYLNLKAGPSIGWGILPDSAPHEARERDYFFILAFWAWAIWIGIGAASLASRFGVTRWTAIICALVPVMLNWSAVQRRTEPLASLARHSAIAFLASAPERAVLFVAGDNDSYPLWYMQQVEGFRKDVTVVTIPMIPARWYLAELERRHGLASPQQWIGKLPTISAVAASAREQNRPLAATVSVAAIERAAVGDLRVLRGWVWVESDTLARSITLPLRAVNPDDVLQQPGITEKERMKLLELPLPLSETMRKSLNSTERYMLGLLACPRLARESLTREAAADSLDSTCNFR